MLPVAFGVMMMIFPSVARAQTTNSSTGAALASNSPTNPSPRPTGSLQMTQNARRTSKLDGATVYNDQGTSVGTIDDMLLDTQGKVSNVVLSLGGFVGVGDKYVEVSFSKLKFEPSKGSFAGSNSNGSRDRSIVLPGVTKESLKAMTFFSY